MPIDFYLKFKREIDEIEKKFINKEITPIQFIENIVLKYQMELENTNIDDITKVKIKNDFIEFIRNFLYKIENNIDMDIVVKNDSLENATCYWVNKLFNKNKSNNVEYDNIYNYNDNIINSIKNINDLKCLIDKLLSYIEASKILTDDKIKNYIKPTIDRIYEKY